MLGMELLNRQKGTLTFALYYEFLDWLYV